MKWTAKIATERNAIVVLVAFHFIGALGITFEPETFLKLSFYNLLLSAFLVMWFSKLSAKAYILMMGIAIATFTLEVVGVKTGIPFGDYSYGNNLGPKFLEVPIVIGINWAILLYCSTIIFKDFNFYLGSLLSACLMLFLDFLIENNVEKLGFWQWENNIIPWQNYISWFVISVVFGMLLRSIKLKENKVAVNLYIIEVAFFVYCFFAK